MLLSPLSGMFWKEYLLSNDPMPYREGEDPPNEKHILARVFHEESGEERLEWVDPDALELAPIKHEDLTPLLPAIRWIWKHLGGYLAHCRTFEDWELGFMRDSNPGGEVAQWAAATYAYLEFIEQTRSQGTVDRAALVAGVISTMNGREDKIEPKSIGLRLKDLMAEAPQSLFDLNNFTDDGEFKIGPTHLS